MSPMYHNSRGTTALALLMSLMGSSGAMGTVIFVNRAATGANNGSSWVNAYTDLQAALAVAGSADEIWVAQGVYHPAPTPAAPGQGRTASFALKTGVSIYGGFAGVETTREQRDWVSRVTVLSGDLLDNDGENWTNRSDNSYHVVTAVMLGHCRLDGFTIRGGHADGEALGATPESNDQGSGANVYDANPHFENIIFEKNYATNHGAVNDHGNSTLIACTFRHNYAGLLGAGLYMHFQSSTQAIRCVFTANETPLDGAGAYTRSYVGASVTDSIFTYNLAGFGAGMYNAEGSSALIERSSFSNNIAQVGGAGVFAKFANPTVRDCIFTDNEAGLDELTGAGGGGGSGGGGFWASGGSPLVDGCTFINNTATFGGGVYFNDGSTGTVLRSTFRDNLANEAGGLYSLISDVTVRDCLFLRNIATGGQFPVGGGVSFYFANALLENCLLDGNTAGLGGGGLYVEGETPLVLNCIFTRNATTWLDQGWGGGILNGFNTQAKVVNSVLIGNTAQRGGGIANAVLSIPTIVNTTLVGNTSTAADARGGGIHTMSGFATNVQNSITWNNAPGEVSGPMTVSHSLVEGGMEGVGNISSDPMFVRVPNAGLDGVWKTLDDDLGDVRLSPGSGAIDAGNAEFLLPQWAVDVSGSPRRVDDARTSDAIPGQWPAVDMGALEFQALNCVADFDGDGDFGTDADIEAFFQCLAGNCCPTCLTADFNNDGDSGTDADIESFFRVLAGGAC